MSNGYMSVNELTKEQMEELKQSHLCMLMDADGETPSWGELANADEIISDEEITEYYADYCFVPEDFFCSCEENA